MSVSAMASSLLSPSFSMDALVVHIRALSEKEDDMIDLHRILKKAECSIQSRGQRLPHFLTQLDPYLQSLGYLYLLDCPYFSSIPCLQFTYAVEFIDSCNATQIRLAPAKFLSVCKKLKDHVMVTKMPIRGVAPLRTAIRKLQTSSEQLTRLHSDFLLLCLLAKTYKAALTVLEDNILEVDETKEFLLYHYYGGMINIGMKRFRKALECLCNVFTPPMVRLSAIAVEAYKKYILVSLILDGKVPALPRYASFTATDLSILSYDNAIKVYIQLKSIYLNGIIFQLDQFIQLNTQIFQKDNNLGLVKQVLSSLYKHNIQRLAQAYLNLSLHDIANSVQLETSKEVEMCILCMIQDGEIFATINQKDGMVSFNEDPEQYRTCEMIEHLDSSIRRAMTSSKKLSTIMENIPCNSKYIGIRSNSDEYRSLMDQTLKEFEASATALSFVLPDKGKGVYNQPPSEHQ